MPATVAQRLYYDSPALEFTATITDIRLQSQSTGPGGEKEQLWQVALDRTAFYPEGGGQPWDTGVLLAVSRSGATLEVPVERVEEDEAGEVWHLVRKPLVQGTEVTGHIDAERRIDHEQQHSGQHLLSAMFLRELGARTVGFHLGAEISTIDLDLKERPSDEDVRRVEDAANRVVYEQRPMLPHFVEREFAEEMLKRGDLRKLPPREGPMRIVQMQGIEFNACGGTHVQNTGHIGAVLVRKLEKVKQGWRVEFVCGGRAVRTATNDFALLTEVAGALSISAGDVPARVTSLLEEAKAAAKGRKALMDELAAAEANALLFRAPERAVVHEIFAGKNVDFAKRAVSKLVAAGQSAVIGTIDGEQGAVVIARRSGSDVHCANVLREVLSKAGARGGGSAEMAQGVCRADQVENIVKDLVERLI